MIARLVGAVIFVASTAAVVSIFIAVIEAAKQPTLAGLALFALAIGLVLLVFHLAIRQCGGRK